MNPVLLILVDGMRPDSLAACGNPFVGEMLAHSRYTLSAQTVMPSVTLPCHMSLFHSVTPERHGILTNTYVPQVRPVRGLCEVLKAAGKRCAFFYNWEELKDLSRPDSLAYAAFVSGHTYTYEKANARTTDLAVDYLLNDRPDFAFLYLGWTDEAGHGYGWMGDEYLRAVSGSFDQIRRVCEVIPDDYTVILTADHGGHGRSHGTDMPEDMTIPILCWKRGGESRELPGGNIIDIAPTITSLLGVAPDPDWEGTPLAI
ncbi:MAG: alkaline phosphatase family protein [Clostridiales bacterium]|nr:alkaline phosphatase family protein [Clostridiales bacterium]